MTVSLRRPPLAATNPACGVNHDKSRFVRLQHHALLSLESLVAQAAFAMPP